MFTDHNWVSVDGQLVVSKLPGEPGFKTLTVEELWTLPIKYVDGDGPVPTENRYNYRSLKPIRLVPEKHPLGGGRKYDLGPKLKEGFALYQLLASRNLVMDKWYRPTTKLNKFRLGLHKYLLRWGVIL